MRVRLAAFFLLLALSAGAAHADIRCVQSELTALGFDPGPVDGEMGRRTTTASRLFAVNSGLTLEPLDAATAPSWCSALKAFAATPAAKSISPFDLVSPPDGVLPQKTLDRMWNVHKTARECFEHPAFAAGSNMRLDLREAELFALKPWTSPFTAVRGAPQCAIGIGSLQAPRPLVSVKLDEEYGERNVDAEIAARWFRNLTTYLRLSDDPVARTLLKDTLIAWAEKGAMQKGIRVSYDARPVDYQMIVTILAILNATGELAGDFSAEERAVIGPWLNGLLKQVAESHWYTRQDNKSYLRASMLMLWGLMTDEPAAIQEAIDVYKLAIHDMRPDGSWPIDSERGGMGLVYTTAATGHLVMLAVALKQARGLDLFSYEVDGRSIHDAVDHAARALEDPGATNAQYAISCSGGGDRFGSIDKPSLQFIDEGGFLLAYAALFPDRPASQVAVKALKPRGVFDSERGGGVPSCLYASVGGKVSLPSLVMPEPLPELPKAEFAVRTLLPESTEAPGNSTSVRSFLRSVVGGQQFEYGIDGAFNLSKSEFVTLNIHLIVGPKWPSALDECGVRKQENDEGHFQAYIAFMRVGTRYVAKNGDCIVENMPKKLAFGTRFLLDSFDDIAIGLLESGDINGIPNANLRTFFQRVAGGELTVGR